MTKTKDELHHTHYCTRYKCNDNLWVVFLFLVVILENMLVSSSAVQCQFIFRPPDGIAQLRCIFRKKTIFLNFEVVPYKSNS